MAKRTYKDRVVIITGASSGIGAALARQLAEEGAFLVLAARRLDRLEDLRTNLSPHCPGAISVQADVTEAPDSLRVVARALEVFGRIDVLILNAGISTNARVQDLQLEVVRRVMDVNYFGAVGPFLQALEALRASRGQVIVISSLAGKKGMATRAAYCASKFALHGFFDSARSDLRREGVAFTLVCPGYVETEVRTHALRGDGSPQGSDDQEGRVMQSAADCAAELLDAARLEKRELIMGGLGPRMLVTLDPLLPEWTERAAEKASARHQT